MAAPKPQSPQVLTGRALPSQPQLSELGACGPPQDQGCDLDLALPQFQGCRHAAEASCPPGEWRWAAHPPGASKAPWASQTQESPQALRLRKPDGRVWRVLESSYPGATPERAELSAAGGEQAREGSQEEEGSRQKPRSVLRLLQAPSTTPTPGSGCQGEKHPPHPPPPHTNREGPPPQGVGGHSSLKCEPLGAPALDQLMTGPWETPISGSLAAASPRQLRGLCRDPTDPAHCSLGTHLSHVGQFIEVLVSWWEGSTHTRVRAPAHTRMWGRMPPTRKCIPTG